VVLAFIQHDLLEEIALRLDDFDERFMDPERTIREHAETLTAVASGDPEEAARAMSAHLVEFEELAASGARAVSDLPERPASLHTA
jgi:DNA-binding GntR family transcriptional regulator